MGTPITFENGLVLVRDPSTLQDGELVEATGCEYIPGTTHLHKQPGRKRITTSGMFDSVRGIQLAQYDIGNDVLIAQAGDELFESVPSISTLTFTSKLADLDATARPRFASMKDRWIFMNGIDDNRIREPNGFWRNLGMVTPGPQTTVSFASTTTNPAHPTPLAGGNFINPTKASDADPATYALSDWNLLTSTQTWTWPTNLVIPGRTLYITTSGDVSGIPTEKVPGLFTLDYSVDGGTTWINIKTQKLGWNKRTDSVTIADGVNIATSLRVRTTLVQGDFQTATFSVFDIYVSAGSSTLYTVVAGFQYAVTEHYVDSDGIDHESAPTPVSDMIPAGTVLASVNVNLPAQHNLFADQFVIYRSLDADGEGYPFIWEIGRAPITNTTWTDVFTPGDGCTDTTCTMTTALDKTHILDVITLAFPTGETLQMEMNKPPPLSSMAIPFQGSMVYVPSGVARRVYYSLPSTISAASLEQVPEFYYLEFNTPRNDSVQSLASSNNGNALLVFFESYTMQVNYLPQSTDPGIFDTRVNEYVSSNRGAAGRDCVCEFTLPTGQTFVAAFDSLGLWVTNTVDSVQEWSRDLDLPSRFVSVDMHDVQLVDNPFMRRLELLYSLAGQRLEYHFYYGRMKQGIDGSEQPLITGPHPMGVQCKHYNIVSDAWVGWSGDVTAAGDIFAERVQPVDDARGYDPTGIVPFKVTTGDKYIGGLSRSVLVEFGYPKFARGVKDVTLTGRFQRDGGDTILTAKTYSIGLQKKIYWHRYADRHRVTIEDLTATSMPALVGYELELRDAGVARDV